MSGQSAHLSLKEAKAMQERTQASGSHSHNHGGGGKKKSMSSSGDMSGKKMMKDKEC